MKNFLSVLMLSMVLLVSTSLQTFASTYPTHKSQHEVFRDQLGSPTTMTLVTIISAFEVKEGITLNTVTLKTTATNKGTAGDIIAISETNQSKFLFERGYRKNRRPSRELARNGKKTITADIPPINELIPPVNIDVDNPDTSLDWNSVDAESARSTC
jgi:hypothetical protein